MGNKLMTGYISEVFDDPIKLFFKKNYNHKKIIKFLDDKEMNDSQWVSNLEEFTYQNQYLGWLIKCI